MTIFNKYQIEWVDRSGGVHQKLMTAQSCERMAKFLADQGMERITITHAQSGDPVAINGAA